MINLDNKPLFTAYLPDFFQYWEHQTLCDYINRELSKLIRTPNLLGISWVDTPLGHSTHDILVNDNPVKTTDMTNMDLIKRAYQALHTITVAPVNCHQNFCPFGHVCSSNSLDRGSCEKDALDTVRNQILNEFSPAEKALLLL